MKFIVLTLFPKMIKGFLSESIIGRAANSGKISFDLVDLKDWGVGRWNKVDDTPYGGGPGMVLRADVVVPAIRDLKKSNREAKTILLTPQGERYFQEKAIDLSKEKELILVCGHYEGFDERVRDYVDLELSVGDYILTGGELAAAIVIDSVSRLLPGVLGKINSCREESFFCKDQDSKKKKEKILEYPHYTKPENFDNKRVPEILKSGNHKMIDEWRKGEAIKRTKERRPDLLK